MKSSTRIAIYLITIVLLSIPGYALAINQSFNPAGFMNKMLNNLMGNASVWQTIFVPAATSLFLFLSATEFAFDTGVRLLRGGEAGKMLAFAILRLISIALFLYFVKNVDWVFKILAQYREWASQAGGVPIGYGPSEVVSIGVEISSNFFAAVTLGYTEILKNPSLLLLGIVTVFAGFFIMAAFGWAALQLFCIYVEFFLVVNAGIINLGFLGSSWTRDMGKKYFSYIIAVGTKLLVALLIVAAVKMETAAWASQVNINKGDLNSMLNVMIMLMVDSLMIAVLVSSIPAYAAGIVSGVSTASANQAVAAGMALTGAATMAVGAAAGGAFMLYGAGKGAAGSVMDAYRNRSGGSGGDMNPGGSSPPPPSGGGGGSTTAGTSSASDTPSAPDTQSVQGSIGGGSDSGGNGSSASAGGKPSAIQRGSKALGDSKKMASSAQKHWHDAQANSHVSPPDIRDKDLRV